MIFIEPKDDIKINKNVDGESDLFQGRVGSVFYNETCRKQHFPDKNNLKNDLENFF